MCHAQPVICNTSKPVICNTMILAESKRGAPGGSIIWCNWSYSSALNMVSSVSAVTIPYLKKLQELGDWYLKNSKYIWIYLFIIPVVSEFCLNFSEFLCVGFLCSYFEKCTEVFPYENLTGHNTMHNEKNHSIKHGGGDVAKYADIINMSCDASGGGHKFWPPGGSLVGAWWEHKSGAWSCMDHDASRFRKRPVPSSVRVSKVCAFFNNLKLLKYI